MNAFNEMERLLKERQSVQWQQTRSENRNSRRLETDTIKIFVAYAKEQGSENAERYLEYNPKKGSRFTTHLPFAIFQTIYKTFFIFPYLLVKNEISLNCSTRFLQSIKYLCSISLHSYLP